MDTENFEATQTYLEKAYELEEQKEYLQALENCDRAIQESPTLAEAHNLRGIILEELRRKEDAWSAYRQAISLDSSYREAIENLDGLTQEINRSQRSTQIVRYAFLSGMVFAVLFAVAG